MKKVLLRFVGKSVLFATSLLWKCPGKLAFNLHQKIETAMIRFNHKHNLDLWDDECNEF